MLRPRWPEDLSLPPATQHLGSLSAFGVTGEVLTLSDHQGHTVAAVCVTLRKWEGLPDPASSPWPGALASLRTALRYSRMGWLETGPASLQPTSDSLLALRAGMVWHGIIRLMERNGLGFALGLSIAPPTDADAPVSDMLPLLLERHGLPAEFTHRPGKYIARASRASRAEAQPEALLPVDLREALRRGAKLCGEPLRDGSGQWAYFWVAHRTVLLQGLPLGK